MDNIARNYPLVLVKRNSLHRCINLPKNEVKLNWNSKGRERLAVLNGIVNDVSTQAKQNLGTEISQLSMSEIITCEMRKITIAIATACQEER